MKTFSILLASAVMMIGLSACAIPGHHSVDIIFYYEDLGLEGPGEKKFTQYVGEDCIIYCQDIERGSVHWSMGGTMKPKCGNVLTCEKEMGEGYKRITRDEYIRIKGEKPTARSR